MTTPRIPRRYSALVALVLLSAAGATSLHAQEKPPAETPEQYAARLAWFRDAKLGVLISFNPSSLAGAEIGWGRRAPRPFDVGRDRQRGSDPVYDNLYKQFNPVKFDARQWVAILKQAGVKYVVYNAKHHDGFSMFHTKQSDYGIANTPFRRDLTKELADACHAAGLRFGVYYSQRDWFHPDYLVGDNRKYTEFMHNQVRELLTNYGRVDIMWFDSFGRSDLVKDWKVYELLAMVRRLQPGILVNNRLAILAEYNRGPRDLWGDFDTPEQRIGSYQYGRAWESCMTLTANPGGWSYHVGARPRGLEACLRALIYCAGGDGNLMWGLGPMPSGEIAPAEVQRLREMGRWLAENGESIYGTRGGPFKPGAWGASTRKGRTIYVHVLKWSGDSVALPKIPPKIVKASLLSGGKAEVEQTDAGIRIAVRPEDRQPIVTSIKLELDALAETVPAI